MNRRAVFLSSPKIWERGHGPDHPLKPERLQRTFELLEEYGAFSAADVRLVEPEPASEDDLAMFHTREYIEIVKALSAGERSQDAYQYGFGPGDNPVFEGMFELALQSVGSGLTGAKLLVNDQCDVAFSIGGGLHHGGPDFASGFCVVNDVAVTLTWLLNQGLRMMYVDIDAHHGDGVQNAFYESDQIMTVSFHQDGRTLFPGTGFVDEVGDGVGKGYSVNVPLPPLTDDELYLWAFRQILPPLFERFQPEILVTQLGVDTHIQDPLTQMMLTTEGQSEIFEIFNQIAPKWLAFGGGGYAIEVVPRAWALAFGIMSDQTLPIELPPKYREKFGGRWLRDQQAPRLDALTHEMIKERVEAVVGEVKNSHGILPSPE
jgi:acetoin utilization protein AcuC